MRVTACEVVKALREDDNDVCLNRRPRPPWPPFELACSISLHYTSICTSGEDTTNIIDQKANLDLLILVGSIKNVLSNFATQEQKGRGRSMGPSKEC